MMQIIQRIKGAIHGAFCNGWSVDKLTLSVCIGVYIAFSPFPVFHTAMMLSAKWFFGLNFPILFVATSINNPWTMIPFYYFDYAFGYWLIHNFLGFSPSFTISLAKIFGSGTICIWSFLVGGNILGITVALLLYFPTKFFFNKLFKNLKSGGTF